MLLIVDLEATCWSDRPDLRPEMEIIEIGAVLVEREPARPIREFQTTVRPVRRLTLSEFCRGLTEIPQARVDAATPFPEAFASFLRWIGDPAAVTPASWGRYDRGQLLQDCGFHGVPYPFGEAHVNLKAEFAALRGVRPAGIGRALRSIGLTFEGSPHRGIDDARNIARIYGWMTLNGYVPPPTP